MSLQRSITQVLKRAANNVLWEIARPPLGLQTQEVKKHPIKVILDPGGTSPGEGKGNRHVE